MACLCAKMGHVNDGRRIIRQNSEQSTIGHGFQALSGLEDGQGAEQPQCVQCLGCVGHTCQIFGLA